MEAETLKNEQQTVNKQKKKKKRSAKETQELREQYEHDEIQEKIDNLYYHRD